MPKGAGNTAAAPKQRQVENVSKKLCKKPTDVRIEDYQYNFKGTRAKVENRCLDKTSTQVTLRNTKSYFTEVLDLIGNDFAKAVKQELIDIE